LYSPHGKSSIVYCALYFIWYNKLLDTIMYWT
jgi:hypothetical protein